MKAAIPVMSDSADAVLSLRFGRSPFFVIVDVGNKRYETIKNPFCDQPLGVAKGLKILLVSELKVDTFIAYELGLKVQQLANEKGIRLILINEKNTTLKMILKHMGVK